MKKLLFFSLTLLALPAFAMLDTRARIDNKSLFDVQEVRFKVKINGKKYSLKVDEIKSGLGAEVDLANAAPNVDMIESLEVIKIRPKFCVDPNNGNKKHCRARVHPADASQRNFIIVDEDKGVMKPARPARQKGGKLKPATQEEQRLVRVQYQNN